MIQPFHIKKIESFLELMIQSTVGYWDHEKGGFFERKNASGEVMKHFPKRLMLVSRQLYVFTATHQLNFNHQFHKDFVIDQLFRLLRHELHDNKQGGFFFSLSDKKKDLYGLSFAIFGLVHYHQLSGDDQALALIFETLDKIQTKLSSPYGGFLEQATEDWQYIPGPRQQNPHMHLLEALIFFYKMYPAAGTAVASLCHELVDLLIHRWTNNAAGALIEVFDHTWQPETRISVGSNANLIEPGHHFEWIWLLSEYAKLFDKLAMVQPVMKKLWDFAYRYGIDAQTGGVFSGLNAQGEVSNPSKRLWPSLEYLKALHAQGLPVEPHLDWLFQHFLFFNQKGSLTGWCEFLNSDNSPQLQEQYLSSVYHITMALLECSQVQINCSHFLN